MQMTLATFLLDLALSTLDWRL